MADYGSTLVPSRGLSELSIDHPQLGGCVEVPVDVKQRRWGTSPGVELGAAEGIERVVVHWINPPLISPAAPPHSGKRSWTGRTAHRACGWNVTLDSRCGAASGRTL